MGTSDGDSLAVTLSLGTLPGAVSCCNMSGFLSSRNIPRQASCLLVFCNVEDVSRYRVDSCLNLCSMVVLCILWSGHILGQRFYGWFAGPITQLGVLPSYIK